MHGIMLVVGPHNPRALNCKRSPGEHADACSERRQQAQRLSVIDVEIFLCYGLALGIGQVGESAARGIEPRECSGWGRAAVAGHFHRNSEMASCLAIAFDLEGRPAKKRANAADAPAPGGKNGSKVRECR